MEKEGRNLLIASLIIIAISASISLTVTLGGELFYHLMALIIGLFLLVKYRKNLNKKDILISLILAAIPSLYAFYQPNILIITAIVIPTYLGAVGAMKNYSYDYILMRYGLPKTLAIILLVGISLGLINLIGPVLSGEVELGFNLSLHNFILSLVPGVTEEVIFRFLFLGFAIHLLKRNPIGRLENIVTYALMIIPHVLGHFSGTIEIGGLIFLTLLFGLPFAILQRKVDLVTAMGSHALVDFIRFVAFNM